MKVRFFDSINIIPPKERIYARMGYKRGITRLEAARETEIDNYIKDASFLIKLKGAAVSIPIEKRDVSTVVFPEGIVFESSILSALLKDSREAMFIGATSGEEIVNSIRESKDSDLTRGVIFDAAASETVDASLTWITDMLNRDLGRESKRLTKRRISCGYGDFPIKYQKIIHKILGLSSLGVKITESFFLVPEKSVTAVMGIIDL